MTHDHASTNAVLDFADITLADVSRVGGKNASLGELFRSLKPHGVGVLDGFATTADAYRRLLASGDLENRLRSIFTTFNPVLAGGRGRIRGFRQPGTRKPR